MNIIKIIVDEIPNNCRECVLELCRKPMSTKRPENLLSKYLTKRHPDCLLVLEEKEKKQ